MQAHSQVLEIWVIDIMQPQIITHIRDLISPNIVSLITLGAVTAFLRNSNLVSFRLSFRTFIKQWAPAWSWIWLPFPGVHTSAQLPHDQLVSYTGNIESGRYVPGCSFRFVRQPNSSCTLYLDLRTHTWPSQIQRRCRFPWVFGVSGHRYLNCRGPRRDLGFWRGGRLVCEIGRERRRQLSLLQENLGLLRVQLWDLRIIFGILFLGVERIFGLEDTPFNTS